MPTRLDALIVYQHLPHYRLGVFEELEADDSITVTFAADTEGRDGIETIDPSQLSRFMKLDNIWIGHFLWQRGLIRHSLFSKHDAYIFLANYTYLSTWLSAVILRLRRKPVYFWTIGWHRPERCLVRWIRKIFYGLAHHLLLYGRDGYEIGLLHGFPADRMHVVGNSTSIGKSGLARTTPKADAHFKLEPQMSYIGAVARLTPEKRFDLLIQAAAILRGRGHHRLGVVLIGDGPSRQSLAANAAAYGVPLLMPGSVYSGEELRDVYRSVKVTVLPERAGLTVIQSLELGTPVVTVDDPYSQVPEFRAVIPGLTGALYKKGSAESLAQAIEAWLERVDEHAESVASACRSEVQQHWSPRVHASAITSAVHRTVSSCRGPKGGF